ncbi:MAG TPA: hypothetical protein VLU46_12380 [Thermoanaerobaculia bacterium]|nr:hypothetical protein [Thermoanaerobaculia bacterium]
MIRPSDALPLAREDDSGKVIHVKKTFLILAIAAAAVACGAKKNVTSTQALAAAVPAATQPAANGTLTGEVAETMNSGGYTYMQIASGSGSFWAAVPQFTVNKGDTVTITVQMEMNNFESKSLNRKFDKLLFATVAQPNAKAAQPAAASAMGTPSQHMQTNAPVAPVKVDKAANGKTVAEVWKRKGVMRDQPVVVRGQVVKFLPQIMGKNWMHLRDGSGSHTSGDDDITVTTKDTAKVGDVVTVTGTLRVDKDFGAGYMYPVLIEDAKISQ